MVEKIGTIKNPLTIIAIFAGIAEISGTGILPFIAESNQTTYLWFLMTFPVLLIVLFFCTLNFNHRVLYAPSDYKDEDNFVRSLTRASPVERAQKVEAEIAEDVEIVVAEGPPAEGLFSLPLPDSVPSDVSSSASRQYAIRHLRENYMLAEDLIFKKLSKEFSSEIQRGVKLVGRGGVYIFDGIVRDKGVITVVEVKLLHSSTDLGLVQKALEYIQSGLGFIQVHDGTNFRVMLVLATNGPATSEFKLFSKINELRDKFSFRIELRIYDIEELRIEFNIL